MKGHRGFFVAAAAVAVLASGSVAVAFAASRDAPPPGATARCRDGTYSYSQHHSGTCSHHGGVAEWLDGSGGSTAGPTPPPATTTTAAPTTARPTAVELGRTVLLARRSRTHACKLGPLPDRRCSPGAYYSGLTKNVLCSPSFRTGTIRNVPESEKHQVEVEYGLAARSYGRTLEIDHLVSLELGGSNDVANLFPEEAGFRSGAPGYHVKDRLENKLHEMVCSGAISLRAAQRQIAANWEKLYRQAFGSGA